MATWLNVVGYEGLYRVSDGGQFYDVIKDRFLVDRIGISVSAYRTIGLSDKEGVYKTAIAHRIVAEAFIPNPENKAQVNHKNFHKRDNRADNLEWVTASENTIHRYKKIKALQKLDDELFMNKYCGDVVAPLEK